MKGIVLEIKNNRAIILTPEGEFISVPSIQSWNIGEEVQFKQDENKNNGFMKKVYAKKGLWIALAACIMLLILPFTNITEASTYLTIDINPSIELELKGDKVINIKALNSDGEKIIAKIPDNDKDLYSVTDNIISLAKEFGYLSSDEENYIMIGLCKDDSNFMIAEYEQFIDDELITQQLEAEIIVMNGTKNEKKLADNKNVSLGKYVLQQSKKLEGIEITDEQLTKDSIKEIIKSNKDTGNKSNNQNPNNENNPNSDSNKGNSGNKNSNNNQSSSTQPNNSNSDGSGNSSNANNSDLDKPNNSNSKNNSDNSDNSNTGNKGNNNNKDKNEKNNTSPNNSNNNSRSNQGTNNANNNTNISNNTPEN